MIQSYAFNVRRDASFHCYDIVFLHLGRLKMRSVITFMQNRIFMEEMKLKQRFALFLEYYLNILLYLFEYSRIPIFVRTFE